MGRGMDMQERRDSRGGGDRCTDWEWGMGMGQEAGQKDP